MTAIKDILRERGLTVTRLAKLAGTGRAHCSEVLDNKPGHGHLTRRRLFPWLNLEEVRTLGWLEEYNRWRGSTGNNSPRLGV